tara:strand:+ start:115 stop:666 length:552 start_codon:yes stop_codon:yes gene_type:complete
MNYIVFEGAKYKVVPISKLGIERFDSYVLFFTKCEKEKFKKFIDENPMEYFVEDNICDEMYIKKFKFFEYFIYFKKGYLVLETPIRLRQLREVGDRYYAIEDKIYKVMKDISGEEMNYGTEMDELPFRRKDLDRKCKKEGCNVKVGKEEYCGKHMILKSFKRWLFDRYPSEFEWGKKIEIFIY